MVRLGIDLTVRARAAAKLSKRVSGSKQSQQPVHESDSNLEAAVKNIANVRGLIVQGDIKQATKLLQTTESQISNFSERAATEATMLRILASVGSQMSVFVHEINASVGMAEGVESALTRLIINENHSSEQKWIWQVVIDGLLLSNPPQLRLIVSWGRGMGLGLTITRNMLEQYGATTKKSGPDIRLPEKIATGGQIFFHQER